jgi:hypothetical protein
MATAEKKVIPVPVKYNVVLTLDQNEAETLLAITGRVGGTPENTRRRFVDNIRVALQTAGVQEVIARTLSSANSIWFAYESIA